MERGTGPGVQRDRRRFGGKGQSLDLGDPWKREGQSLDDPIRKRLGFGGSSGERA